MESNENICKMINAICNNNDDCAKELLDKVIKKKVVSKIARDFEISN